MFDGFVLFTSEPVDIAVVLDYIQMFEYIFKSLNQMFFAQNCLKLMCIQQECF